MKLYSCDATGYKINDKCKHKRAKDYWHDLSRKIFVAPLKAKIHIFASPCHIL